MNIDEILSRELSGTARGRLAEVDTESLKRVARREQRLRRRIAAAGAVLVAASVVTCVALLEVPDRGVAEPPVVKPPTVTPAPPPKISQNVEDMPQGRGSMVPWAADGVLHVGSREITTTVSGLKSGGETVLVNTGETSWSYLRGDQLTPLLRLDGLVGLALSAGGDKIAVMNSLNNRQVRVEVRDAATDAAVGTTLVNHQSIADFQDGRGPRPIIVGVLDDGRVFWSDATNQGWLWRPGRPPVRIEGLQGGRLSDFDDAAWPGRGLFVPAYGRGNTRGDYGPVTDDGTFIPQGTVQTNLGSWSPDGQFFVYDGDQDAVPQLGPGSRRILWVTEPANSNRGARLALPELTDPGHWGVFGWEDPAHVILRSQGDRLGANTAVVLARCNVDSRACELTGDALPDQAIHPD
ncbi:MAG: hypothetical protein ACRCYU_03505 [Nocardioides sp.]